MMATTPGSPLVQLAPLEVILEEDLAISRQLNVVEIGMAWQAAGATPLFDQDVDVLESGALEDVGEVQVIVMPRAVVDQLRSAIAIAAESCARVCTSEPEVVDACVARRSV